MTQLSIIGALMPSPDAAPARPARPSPLGEIKTLARQLLNAQMAPVRLIQWKRKFAGMIRRRDRMIADYLAQPGLKKLHIGCGHNKIAGWLNTDITDHADVAYLDATSTFPMPDASFDYAFSEHMIEHVPYEAGAVMFRECLRVLKPGGKVRIATPNLDNILALHTATPTEAQSRYIRWSTDRHTPGRGQYSGTHVVNTFMNSWGHQFVYDVASLTRQLVDAGFTNVTVYRPEQSDDANLRGVEVHAREIGSVEMNEFETMVLEGTKPA